MNKICKQKRHRHRFLSASIIVVVLIISEYALAKELRIGDFANVGLSGWEQKIFNGSTEYRLTKENNKTVVEAKSQGTASGLVKEISFDPQKYRYLRWSWKVINTVSGGDETTKAGDDYAARIYVVFPGTFFWQTKAINYIWANHLTKGASLKNAYSASAIMIAVQSGPNGVGQWHTEQRDLLADYRDLFGSDPGQVGAVAIMTDTDDTGESAIAWYGDITLSTEP